MDKNKIKKYLHIINQFENLNIAVVGDFMLDKYIFGSCSRISPEAPVPVVNVKTVESRLGGAGNVAANLSSLGCSVDTFGVIGNDKNGEELIDLLRQENIVSELLKSKNEKITSVKTRIIADRQQVTRVDEENRVEISIEEADKIIEKLQEKSNHYNAIILSDYGKGVLSSYLIQKIITNFDKMIIVDPKGNNYEKYRGATIVKPNFNEFKEAVNNRDMHLNSNNLESYAEKLREQLDLSGMVVTLGEHGVFIQNPEKDYKIIPTRAKSVFDVSGAGDTFTALLTMSLCIDKDWFIAGDIANHGSGIVVGEVGTSYLKKEKLVQNIKNTI